jgi:MerR family copper efflux transcriptional regulator
MVDIERSLVVRSVLFAGAPSLPETAIHPATATIHMTVPSAPPLLKIGELQAKSQVSIKTIRYYEEIGLLQAASRTEGGFRLFSPDTLTRLAFVKRAQRLGFSLQEIRHILEIHDQGEPPCAEVRDRLERKICDIDDRIQQLQTLKDELRALMERPSASGDRPADVICPILQAPEAGADVD